MPIIFCLPFLLRRFVLSIFTLIFHINEVFPSQVEYHTCHTSSFAFSSWFHSCSSAVNTHYLLSPFPSRRVLRDASNWFAHLAVHAHLSICYSSRPFVKPPCCFPRQLFPLHRLFLPPFLHCFITSRCGFISWPPTDILFLEAPKLQIIQQAFPQGKVNILPFTV